MFDTFIVFDFHSLYFMSEYGLGGIQTPNGILNPKHLANFQD